MDLNKVALRKPHAGVMSHSTTANDCLSVVVGKRIVFYRAMYDIFRFDWARRLPFGANFSCNPLIRPEHLI